MSRESIDQADKKPKKQSSLLAKLRLGGIIIAAILVVIVAARNWEEVTIDVLGIEATMPQAILVILTFFFGLGVGVLLAFLRPWRKSKK